MTGKRPDQSQRDCIHPLLLDIINPRHELTLLTGQLHWEKIQAHFSLLYSCATQPTKSVRLMVDLLQRMYKLRKRLKQIRRDFFVSIFRGIHIWDEPVCYIVA